MADNSRHFGGTSGDLITKTTPTGVATNAAFTYGAWVYATDYPNGRIAVRVGPASAGVGVRGTTLRVNSSGTAIADLAGNGSSTAGTLATATWGFISARSSGSGLTAFLNGSAGSFSGGAGTNVNAGDVFQLSDNDPGGSGNEYWKGRIAWAFWLQGVDLSSDGGYSYANNPHALITDYGTSGAITANALKILWPCQCSNANETDKSGVGNDGTYTGTSLGSGDGPSPSTPWNPCVNVTTLSLAFSSASANSTRR